MNYWILETKYLEHTVRRKYRKATTMNDWRGDVFFAMYRYENKAAEIKKNESTETVAFIITWAPRGTGQFLKTSIPLEIDWNTIGTYNPWPWIQSSIKEKFSIWCWLDGAISSSKAHTWQSTHKRRSPWPNTTHVIEIARTPSNVDSTFFDFDRRRKISSDLFMEKNRKILESSSLDFGVVSNIVTATFTTKRRPIITKKI